MNCCLTYMKSDSTSASQGETQRLVRHRPASRGKAEDHLVLSSRADDSGSVNWNIIDDPAQGQDTRQRPQLRPQLQNFTAVFIVGSVSIPTLSVSGRPVSGHSHEHVPNQYMPAQAATWGTLMSLPRSRCRCETSTHIPKDRSFCQ